MTSGTVLVDSLSTFRATTRSPSRPARRNDSTTVGDRALVRRGQRRRRNRRSRRWDRTLLRGRHQLGHGCRWTAQSHLAAGHHHLELHWTVFPDVSGAFTVDSLAWRESVSSVSVASDGGLAREPIVASPRFATLRRHRGVLHRRQRLQPDLDLLALHRRRIVTVGGMSWDRRRAPRVRPPTNSRRPPRPWQKVNKRKRDMETPSHAERLVIKLRCRWDYTRRILWVSHCGNFQDESAQPTPHDSRHHSMTRKQIGCATAAGAVAARFVPAPVRLLRRQPPEPCGAPARLAGGDQERPVLGPARAVGARPERANACAKR